MLLRKLVLALCFVPSLVAAQDGGTGITFELGLGASQTPEYFGAEDTKIGVTSDFTLEQLQFGPVGITTGERHLGLSRKTSVRFIDGRSADDYAELDGLDDVDYSVELGGGLQYKAANYEVFGVLRYGIIGHQSLVAEFGGDLIAEPNDKLTLSAGPRVLWGSDDYAETYFGVTDSSTVYDSFDASAGIVSAGIQGKAHYAFNDIWGITGKIRYNQLREDAADSPISQSDDQFSGQLLITRRFSLHF